LKRSKTFTRFLDDGRICITNNPAERAVRGIAVGRRNWTFCGSDAGRDRAAVLYAPIETAKPCDVDPKAWLAEKRELAAAPVHWLRDLPEGEIPDIMRCWRDQSLAELQVSH